eukprot:CAMPEP_0181311466 /NCGR_PEP_ID=MMETSP1101-20121128/13152_1 /TAXON_ID=46948 /ORGANISM="Rhodomonas abbreviata, Strain Caron Lab Isolate" /LENGTH=150 /DNA_ID=CAMNT_0023418199 /DNA_START=116 /DNA_END=569 /DNA_ORIENTATION=-
MTREDSCAESAACARVYAGASVRGGPFPPTRSPQPPPVLLLPPRLLLLLSGEGGTGGGEEEEAAHDEEDAHAHGGGDGIAEEKIRKDPKRENLDTLGYLLEQRAQRAEKVHVEHALHARGEDDRDHCDGEDRSELGERKGMDQRSEAGEL